MVYKGVIQWREGDDMQQVMLDFKFWYGLLSVHGAIDCTQIKISKSKEYLEDYYCYKTGGYSVVAQAVVDSHKQFMQLYVELLGLVNDQRVLRRSSLWQRLFTNN